MADRVIGGLLLPDYAQGIADGLVNYQQNQLFQQHQAEYARNEQMRQNADLARAAAATGNIQQARQIAQEGNNWAAYDALDAAERARVGRQVSSLGSLAYDLKNVKDLPSREAMFDARSRTLIADGATQEEIMAARARLGDDAYLDAYINAGTTLADKIKRQQEVEDDQRKQNYALEQKSYDIQFDPTGGGYRVVNGQVEQATTPGIKPELIETKLPDGRTVYTPYAGVPSQAVGNGGNASGGGASGGAETNRGARRTMGWTPRIGENPDASVDNKIKLISQAAGASADDALSHEQFLNLDMTKLEGRPAGRHNYGNMRNVDGSWKQFNSPQEYQVAQRAWLERRWKEGARTIRDAVEGRVVGGGNGGQRQASNAPAGNGSFTVGEAARETYLNGKEAQDRYGYDHVVIGADGTFRSGHNDPQGSAGKGPNDGQNKAASFARRMNSANNTMQGLYNEGYRAQSARSGVDRAVGRIPLVGNFLTSDQSQRQEQAERDFVNAILRRESGAAIGANEFASAERQYFPRPGDDARVLAQKAAARRLAVENMTKEAGPALSSNRPATQSKPSNGGDRRPPAGATMTASGKNGEKIALVNGKWTKY